MRSWEVSTRSPYRASAPIGSPKWSWIRSGSSWRSATGWLIVAVRGRRSGAARTSAVACAPLPGGVWVPGGLRRLQSGWDGRSPSGGFDSRPPPLIRPRLFVEVHRDAPDQGICPIAFSSFGHVRGALVSRLVSKNRLRLMQGDVAMPKAPRGKRVVDAASAWFSGRPRRNGPQAYR